MWFDFWVRIGLRGRGCQVQVFAILLLAASCSSPESAAVAGVTQLSESAATDSTVISPPAPTTTEPRVATAVPIPVPSPTAPSSVLDADLDWLAGSEGPTVQISASVRSMDGQELWGLNSQRRLYPASNQKLVVAAGVLELLENDHRFHTTVAVDSDMPGTLFVLAGGDPTLTRARLTELAGDVAAARSTPVDQIVVDTDRWRTAYRAPGWQDWHIPTYVGPLSTFMLDDNRWSKAQDFTDNPDLSNGIVFAEALRQAGVEGTLAVELGSAPLEVTAIADSVSPPVERLLETMLGSSDNQIADGLVRELDADAGNQATTPGGLARIRTALRASGVQFEGIDGDGSGLSRANLRSASEWTAMLASISDEPWFDRFEAVLPVAGRSGTLAGRLSGPRTAGNVRAKTGTIIGGRSLSGYLTLASGEELTFSIVVNGDGSHGALDEIDRWVVALAGGRLTN